MSSVMTVLQALLRGAGRGLGLLSALLGALFGQWTPPFWLRALGAGLRRGTVALRAAWSRHPRAGAASLATLVVLGLGGAYGWHWYQHRPKPVLVSFSVQGPARTCYECEAPANQAKPVTISFSASAAPLERAGKPLDAQKSGLGLSPAVDGSWVWLDDKTLQFTPKSDWPIGQTYALTFARKGFVAPHVHLQRYAATFASVPFSAHVSSTEFYQDPVNANDKKVVVTVDFSHPVDTGDFEHHVKLTLYNRVNERLEEEVAKPGFSVEFDKYKTKAYIHSEQISVPAKAGRLAVEISAGLRAQRGGNKTALALTSSTDVPGLFALRVDQVQMSIARDERDDPQQVLMLHTSYSTTEKEVTAHVQAWVLPRGAGDQPQFWSVTQVRPELLTTAERLPLQYSANEQEHVELHSFRVQADPGRYVYVRIDKGLKSFGGYILGEPVDAVLRVPDYPKEVRIAHEGALLAMSGARKLTIFTRDLSGLRVRLGRLLPDQLQHLVTQTNGDFATAQFSDSWNFNEANITERYTRKIRLPKLAPGSAHYETLDLGDYLNKDGADRRGIFFVHVSNWTPPDDSKRQSGKADDDADDAANNGSDPESDNAEGNGEDNADDDTGGAANYGSRTRDARLIVVTDLGLVVKRAVDGAQDVFVQSIKTGDPVAGVSLQVIGRNGEAVLTQTSDAGGHAHFADLRSFKGEHQPVLYLARKNGDMSFLPIGREDRELQLSRFDVGGVSNRVDQGRLTAYLFSDRGLYRPGDEIRVGAIIKTLDWRSTLAGVPLRVEVSDPRGTLVKREAIRLSAAGFEEIHYTPRETAPTGDYTVSLAIIKSPTEEDPIGSITVRVQEFQPDRLHMNVHLSKESAGGWVTPDALQAHVDLQNLFGTAAENRRISATLTLTPSFPSFPAYKDYRFFDPQAAQQSYSDELADATSDAQGQADFDLNLQRFARATYLVHFVAQGFEADGGRGVAAETAQLVSNLPYLIGWKPDGALGYVSRGAARSVALLAIAADAKPTAAEGLTLVRIEHRYVSVLTRLDNGTYKYVSKLKDLTLDEQAYALSAAGGKLNLDTQTPGDYSYVVEDSSGQRFARIDYTVAGAANLAARLDKNAELKLVLDKKDYAPGEDISLQITAPYVGAGLITIERDKVYAYQWFKTTTTASVQHIKVPDGIEGNAYVSVSFVRDPASSEIYTSPLSYGVQPFSIALDQRTAQLSLDTAAQIKPGQRLNIHYKSDRPARIVVFAVDEGILQVAHYKTPNPLTYFFEKRALDVRTSQILDLILPEFVHDAGLAAPGGDADGALGQHLNPFKRKTDKPVVYWSGIIDADSSDRIVSYDVPDYFNGSLRVMAVAVADDAIGVAESKTVVRGDFVLTPNAPLTVTPGDEFDVSVGLANNVVGSGDAAPVQLSVEATPQLEVQGAAQQIVKVGELHEGVAHFKFKVRDALGAAALHFTAQLNDKSAALATTLSVRPATPYRTQLSAGVVRGSREDVPTPLEFYAPYRKLEAGVSILPLSLAHGLSSYLGNYPYDCTEQLVSQALPAIVLGARPEFGYVRAQKGADLAGLIAELRQRQNSDGAYRYWGGGVRVVEFVSLYTQLALLEASERGQAVPRDLLTRGNDYLRTLAGRDGDTLADERNTALAIYLLTRQGNVMANEAAALQKRLDERYGAKHGDWSHDIAAAYLAAAYQLMKQQSLAERTIAHVKLGQLQRYDVYHGPMARDAELLYLLARHFPDRAKDLPGDFFIQLVQHVQKNEYDSLSAAEAILALDQYAAVVGPQAAGKLGISELLKAGKTVDGKSERALTLPDLLLPKVPFSAETAKLRFTNGSDAPAFYWVDQSGFERQPPQQAIKQGFEIIREYTDSDGHPLNSVKLGDEVVVHVKFRAVDREPIEDGVLVDLLPGGFDLVLPRVDPAAQEHLSATDGQDDSGSEDDEAQSDDDDTGNRCGCGGFFWSLPRGFPDYADLREDRVVAYGRIGSDIEELTYRIKATNIGSFTVPPAYGESMYDRAVLARSVAARITVTAP